MNTKIKMLVLLAALAAPSLGHASAGKVLFTLGRVDIQRNGAVVPATRGMEVQAGDQFELGPTGRTQIRMADGAMIALQPGSSFVIEEYQMPDAAAPVPASAPTQATRPTDTTTSNRITPAPRSTTSGGGRALFSLLKGGFRTITGLIGKGGQDVYQLKTPVATIGIRGTTYSATYCAGSCKSAANGLYVGVSSGKVVVTNNSGSQSLNDNQYGYVKDDKTPPEKKLEPPTDVLDPPIEDTDEKDDSGDSDDGAPAAGTDGGNSDGQSGGDGDGGDGSTGDSGSGDAGSGDDDSGGGDSGSSSSDGGTSGGTGGDSGTGDGGNFGDAGDGSFDSPPPDTGSSTPPPNTTTESKPPEVPGAEPVILPTRFVAHATGPISGRAEFAGAALNDTNEISVNDADELLGFRGPIPPDNLADYALDTAQNVNLGFDPASNLRWGRWSTQSVQSTPGSPAADPDLHWIISPVAFEHPVLPITGSASYSLVGNTDPTDNLGNIGVLGSAQFSVNFSTGAVNSGLSLSINNQVWSASGSGTIIDGFPAFGGTYGNVIVSGQTGGTGSFAGFFTGPPGSGVPPGVGLGYSLNSGTTTISGAAAFGNPKGAQ